MTRGVYERLHETCEDVDGDDLIATTHGSANFREGVRAFLEKRPPRWTGA